MIPKNRKKKPQDKVAKCRAGIPEDLQTSADVCRPTGTADASFEITDYTERLKKERGTEIIGLAARRCPKPPLLRKSIALPLPVRVSSARGMDDG